MRARKASLAPSGERSVLVAKSRADFKSDELYTAYNTAQLFAGTLVQALTDAPGAAVRVPVWRRHSLTRNNRRVTGASCCGAPTVGLSSSGSRAVQTRKSTLPHWSWHESARRLGSAAAIGAVNDGLQQDGAAAALAGTYMAAVAALDGGEEYSRSPTLSSVRGRDARIIHQFPSRPRTNCWSSCFSAHTSAFLALRSRLRRWLRAALQRWVRRCSSSATRGLPPPFYP